MTLRYPINNDDKWQQAFIQFQSYSDRVDNAQVDESIVMYAPPSITIPGSVNYDTNYNLGTLGSIANTYLNGGTGIIDTLTSAFSGDGKFFENLGIELPSDISSMDMAKRFIGNLIGLEDFAAFSSQVAVNPHTKALFKGVSIRNFSFSFQMIPTSKQEADEINEIVKSFRANMYPETDNTGRAGNRVGGDAAPWFYRFPNKYRILINTGMSRSAENEVADLGDATFEASKNNLIKSKPAFLTDVNVTYNPNRSAWHKDGNPFETNLTLSFAESETLEKSDILDGGF